MAKSYKRHAVRYQTLKTIVSETEKIKKNFQLILITKKINKMSESSLEDSRSDGCFITIGSSIQQREWLTPELFYEFLEQDYPNFIKVKKFDVNSAVAPGENFLTVMLRITLELEMPDDGCQLASYMLKISPRTEQMQNMVTEWQIFDKELNMYSQYIPKFEEIFHIAGGNVKFAPKLLIPQGMNIDEDIVMLEDLRLKGFRNAKRLMGLDMLHTEAVLKKLAQFHAVSAKYVEVVGEFSSIYDQSLATDVDNLVEYRFSLGKIFRDHLHLYECEYLKEKLKIHMENQFDPYQHKSKRDPEEFHVLNHGDLWVNNIMFQYNEDESIKETYFIDFQMSRYGPPAHDLLYFLLSSVNLDIKLQNFDYFISYYHRHLIENLTFLEYQGKLPTLRDIHMSLHKHDYWAYAIITNLITVVLCESRDDVNIDCVLNVDNGEEAREAMFSSEKYVECMKTLLPWLDNRGVFDL
ncbi:uncharacterized protein LOC142220486 [Haematobia irritans]|uniref:uncharacterized protein LOC142220486 n=1 Tax=Haematobia irritans TaxID=7368 RepID=UPI003F4FC4E8